MRGARARGVYGWALLRGHIAPVSVLPTLALLGTRLPELIAGAAIVETVFGWPGMAAVLVESAAALDFPLLAALTVGAARRGAWTGSALSDAAAVAHRPARSQDRERSKLGTAAGSCLAVICRGRAVGIPLVAGRTGRRLLLRAAAAGPGHSRAPTIPDTTCWCAPREGLRVSLLIAVVCAVVATVLGSGHRGGRRAGGGWVDAVVMRLVDGFNALPHLVVGIVIAAMWRVRRWRSSPRSR